MKYAIYTILLVFFTLNTNAQIKKEIKILKGEKWWGCYSTFGKEQPFDQTSKVLFDQYKSDNGNQASPVWVSSSGRYIWSDGPLRGEFRNGLISLESTREIVLGQTKEKTLASAYQEVSSTYFPASGNFPEEQLFINPQLNTWIELLNNQNQQDILDYAHEAVENGIKPGVIMLDGGWQKNFGLWDFNGYFPTPKKMVDELHDLGYKVMLWVVPYAAGDDKTTNKNIQKGFLLQDPVKPKQPYLVNWWNGFSPAYDLSNPKAKDYFVGVLKGLMNKYGIDGFKFDAGDPDHFIYPFDSYMPMSKVDYAEAFGKLGLLFPFNEYRVSFKMGGQALMQRMRDKPATWDAFRTLIPDMLTAGLMGYPYTCADMIGGGEAKSYVSTPEEYLKGTRHLNVKVDQELFVRGAQCQALMPMMQISIAPWRVLDKEHYDAFLKATKLHEEFAPLILRLANEAAKTGEPIMRNMEYVFPGNGYTGIKDQFMLGDSVLVAPVVAAGQESRKVVFPKGLWLGDDGSKIKGGKTVLVNVPLERLAYFKRIK